MTIGNQQWPARSLADVHYAPQSDGPQAGRTAAHIYMPECGTARDLPCGWCDPAQPEPLNYPGVRNIARSALTGGIPNVVITGHEPLAHQHTRLFADLVYTLDGAGAEVRVHTTGRHDPTRAPDVDRHIGFYLVAPNPTDLHIRARVTAPFRPQDPLTVFAEKAHRGRACFLFRVNQPTDLDTVDRAVDFYNVPRHAVWIALTPGHTGLLAHRLNALIAPTVERGWALSPGLPAAPTPAPEVPRR